MQTECTDERFLPGARDFEGSRRASTAISHALAAQGPTSSRTARTASARAPACQSDACSGSIARTRVSHASDSSNASASSSAPSFSALGGMFFGWLPRTEQSRQKRMRARATCGREAVGRKNRSRSIWRSCLAGRSRRCAPVSVPSSRVSLRNAPENLRPGIARRSPHHRARYTEPVALWTALSRSAQPSRRTTRNNNSRRGRWRAPVVACHDTRDENLALRGREKVLREHLSPKIVALRARKWHIATCSAGVVRPFQTCCSARPSARVASGARVPLETVVDSL